MAAAAGEHAMPRMLLAWGVHLYTAFGAVVGFLALRAAFERDYRQTFLLLAIALVIDSSDGALARAAQVKHLIPWIDGELLDNIVDYLTYVVVPVAVFIQPGMLPQGTRYLALAVLLASAYGFSRTDAKGMVEHYFQGFPSYWNVLAFYFVVLGTPPALNLGCILLAIALVFAPMRWIYPSRMETLRTPTLALGIGWAAVAFILILELPEPSLPLALLSLLYPLYYTTVSMLLHFRG